MNFLHLLNSFLCCSHLNVWIWGLRIDLLASSGTDAFHHVLHPSYSILQVWNFYFTFIIIEIFIKILILLSQFCLPC